MKRKLLSLILAIVSTVSCAFTLSACGNGDSAKVMNVSLNPKLEFVLDKADKVVSVNALNDDGNHVISISVDQETAISAFEGLTAEEAIELFLEITEENGYLITGNEEEIKIEISGDAEKLKNKLKEKANAFFTEKGLNVDVITENIQKTDIAEEVKKCMKELTDAEIDAMTEEELIELLKNSRKETANLLTQELKEAYYDIRHEKINIAELEELLEIVNGLTGSESIIFETFKQNMATLNEKLSALEEAYAEYFLADDSAFKIAKEAYVTAKQELLDKRLELAENGITEAEREILQGYETAVTQAKNTLELARETAEGIIALAKGAVNQVFEVLKGLVGQIKTALNALGVSVEALETAKDNARQDFKNHFEEHGEFSNHVGHDKSHWGNR